MSFTETRGQVGKLVSTSPIPPSLPTFCAFKYGPKLKEDEPENTTSIERVGQRPVLLWQPTTKKTCYAPFQALLTRLAKASERLKLVDGENARESLSTAIQLFRYETKHTLSTGG